MSTARGSPEFSIEAYHSCDKGHSWSRRFIANQSRGFGESCAGEERGKKGSGEARVQNKSRDEEAFSWVDRDGRGRLWREGRRAAECDSICRVVGMRLEVGA